MVRREAISREFHTKIKCHSFVHSFIHLFLLQTLFACVLYAKQHACKEGGVVRRLPKLDVPGVASLSIRVKVRGTDTGVLIQ